MMPFPPYRELCSWVSFISWSDQIKDQDQPSPSFTFCLWGSRVSRERQHLPSCDWFTHLARFAYVLASIRMSFLCNTGCHSPAWTTFCFSIHWLDACFDCLPSLATVSKAAVDTGLQLSLGVIASFQFSRLHVQKLGMVMLVSLPWHFLLHPAEIKYSQLTDAATLTTHHSPLLPQPYFFCQT